MFLTGIVLDQVERVIEMAKNCDPLDTSTKKVVDTLQELSQKYEQSVCMLVYLSQICLLLNQYPTHMYQGDTAFQKSMVRYLCCRYRPSRL